MYKCDKRTKFEAGPSLTNKFLVSVEDVSSWFVIASAVLLFENNMITNSELQLLHLYLFWDKFSVIWRLRQTNSTTCSFATTVVSVEPNDANVYEQSNYIWVSPWYGKKLKRSGHLGFSTPSMKTPADKVTKLMSLWWEKVLIKFEVAYQPMFIN